MNQRDADRQNADTLYQLAENKRAQLKSIEARIELNISATDVETWSIKWEQTHAEMTQYVRSADAMVRRAWFS